MYIDSGIVNVLSNDECAFSWQLYLGKLHVPGCVVIISLKTGVLSIFTYTSQCTTIFYKLFSGHIL